MKIYWSTIFLVVYLAFLPPCAFGEGDIRSMSEYEYWDNGKLKGRDVYDLGGKRRVKVDFTADGILQKMSLYDDSGKNIEEAFYSHDGKLKSGVDGWAAMRWFYNGPTLVARISYDAAGKPIQRLLYSESGKIIARQYADADKIDPYEMNNTMMMILKNRETAAKE